MLLKIYLGISILTFVMYILTNMSLANRTKAKYGDKLKKKNKKKDVPGVILSYTKIIIQCFLPLWNIVLLFVIIFCSSKVTKAADEAVEKELKEQEYID